MKLLRRRRKGVAPVLATLLMIAVAVAMSVIIFMWSQGFLANTSSATGSQQGSQNQAAQSSISIDDVLFLNPATTNTRVTIFVRNVGAVSVSLGLITITGSSSNAGFQTATFYTRTDMLTKGQSVAIQSEGQTLIPRFVSGDVITIKVTTSVGTFAQQSFTVP